MSALTPLLDIDHISYSQHPIRLLAPVSFRLDAGEQLYLTGPSGSGKSTLLKIIASLLEPTTGTLLFRGDPVARLKPEQYRREVSYCFQSPMLFGETVRENLALPWHIRQQKAEPAVLRRWLEKVRLPGDLLDKNISLLSGGEKQRVALLRNLQFLPAVLLLDEITSALDEENKQGIAALIDDVAKQHGTAVIWITHDKLEIERAQRLITLTAPARSEDEPA